MFDNKWTRFTMFESLDFNNVDIVTSLNIFLWYFHSKPSDLIFPYANIWLCLNIWHIFQTTNTGNELFLEVFRVTLCFNIIIFKCTKSVERNSIFFCAYIIRSSFPVIYLVESLVIVALCVCVWAVSCGTRSLNMKSDSLWQELLFHIFC